VESVVEYSQQKQLMTEMEVMMSQPTFTLEDELRLKIEQSGYCADGFAEHYDAYRPKPPAILPALLMQMAQIERPRLVVDLGSGTGLSTYIWAEHAEQVIGIEPNEVMRRQAERHEGFSNVRFQAGFGHETHLPSDSADIVTCAQALYWMEPEATLAEIARILRPGGLFCDCHYLWPPALPWKVEQAMGRLRQQIDKPEEAPPGSREAKGFTHEEQLAQIRQSDWFRYVRELFLSSEERGNVARLVGLACSTSTASRFLTLRSEEAQRALVEFRQIAEQTLGAEIQTWCFSYRIKVAVK
jgi:ubiquinone/menaquinone biosynthesis C-methylase UbiE